MPAKMRQDTSAADALVTLLSPSTTLGQCTYEVKTECHHVSKIRPVLLYDKAHGIGVCVEAVGPKVQLEDYPTADAKHAQKHADLEFSDVGYHLFLAKV